VRVARCVRCGRQVSGLEADVDDGGDIVCFECEDPGDFDADELGLDPEEEYDA